MTPTVISIYFGNTPGWIKSATSNHIIVQAPLKPACTVHVSINGDEQFGLLLFTYTSIQNFVDAIPVHLYDNATYNRAQTSNSQSVTNTSMELCHLYSSVWRQYYGSYLGTLLQKHAINGRGYNYYILLFIESQFNSIKCCVILFQNGANLNLFERNRFASYFGLIEISNLHSLGSIDYSIMGFCGRAILAWAIKIHQDDVKNVFYSPRFSLLHSLEDNFGNKPSNYKIETMLMYLP
jgi:hypothetical protein